MTKIGMIVAVEIDSVLKQYGEPTGKSIHGGFPVMTYESDTHTIYVVNCGMGEIAAAAGVQMLISELGAELIVNFGVVGGLTEQMSVTKTCVVTDVVHYDMDTSEGDIAEQGRYLEYPDIYIPTTKKLADKAAAICPELRKVICASADKFVGAPEKKRALAEKFGAHICDMESAGIVLTCNRSKIPCLLIKTVSDSIEGGAEEFQNELNRASGICLAITDRIIKELNTK